MKRLLVPGLLLALLLTTTQCGPAATPEPTAPPAEEAPAEEAPTPKTVVIGFTASQTGKYTFYVFTLPERADLGSAPTCE